MKLTTSNYSFNDKVYAEIMSIIKETRKNRNMTQTDVAKPLFVTQPQYLSYETGRSPLTVKKLLEIGFILNIDISTLLKIAQEKAKLTKGEANERANNS